MRERGLIWDYLNAYALRWGFVLVARARIGGGSRDLPGSRGGERLPYKDIKIMRPDYNPPDRAARRERWTGERDILLSDQPDHPVLCYQPFPIDAKERGGHGPGAGFSP